jgi:hypothetical protein
MDTRFVGIDLSRDTLSVAVHPGGETQEFPNTDQGKTELVTHLLALEVALVVVEAGGSSSAPWPAPWSTPGPTSFGEPPASARLRQGDGAARQGRHDGRAGSRPVHGSGPARATFALGREDPGARGSFGAAGGSWIGRRWQR